jgi:hypothetical protein
MRWRRALGLGLRTTGGGGGAAVSKAIAERERARGQKFAKCGERERAERARGTYCKTCH